MFGRREVTLSDTAEPQTLADLEAARPVAEPVHHRAYSKTFIATAILAPAVILGLAGVLLTPAGDESRGPGSAFVPASASAAQLAKWSEEPSGPNDLAPLAPIVERNGKVVLADGKSVPAVTRPSLPRRISIPDAGVSATVESVGADDAGLELPHSQRAGWWQGGPRPGEIGRSVIVGHLDSTKGPDVFAKVPDLRKGAPISVQDASGTQHLYRVVGVTRVEKANFPTNEVYGPARTPVLVLVTCGGPYDTKRGHYRDNVLVYARAI
jgi:hypothetical protein